MKGRREDLMGDSKDFSAAGYSSGKALEEIDAIAAAKSGGIGWFSDWTKELASIEDAVDRYLNQGIEKMSDGDMEKLVTNIRGRREKLSLSSGITNQIIGLCQNVLGFGAAGVALMVGFIDKIKQLSLTIQKLLAIIGIFYFELVLVSLAVLILYLLQARFRYPSLYFEKMGNAWPFFYYASITPVSRSPIQLPPQRFEASIFYAKDFVSFADRVFQETGQGRLRAELQQYFLLMSYQAYVHQFSLRMANLFLYAFISTVATTVAMIALMLRSVI
jgi:hypothetical protein